MHAFGRLTWIQGLFYGIGAAVIAIITQSAYKLVRATTGKNWFLWVVFSALAVTSAWTESEIVYRFVLGGVILQKPLAVAVVGGFCLSTILTLLVGPVLYSLLEAKAEASSPN